VTCGRSTRTDLENAREMLAPTVGWNTLGWTEKKYTQTDEKKEKEIKKLNQNQKSFRDLILQFKCT